jgi:hypothetical protein
MNVCGKELKINGRIIRIGSVAAEGFVFLEDPRPVIAELKKCNSGIDLFTFSQRVPNEKPLYDYPMEWDNVAALPITTFDEWWNKQIIGKTRNKARQAEKKGVVLREVPFDDKLAYGIWELYNECPVRQGRVFPHYGKDLAAVHAMSATFLDCSIFVGAFLEEKLIGFAKLTVDETRTQATVMHILAMIQHRDKSITNALIAECVRSCAARGIPYIVYSNFAYGKKQKDTLAEFKERNGFVRVDLPRYYVPLTTRGVLALRLGLHRKLSERIPESIASKIRQYRQMWYLRKYGDLAAS